MNYYVLFILALATSVLVSLLVLFLFPRLGLMDRPHLYGLKRKAIPYPAGVVIWIVFISLVLVFVEPLRPSVQGLLLGGTLIMAVSFWDDRKKLPPWFRLVVQFLAAGILIYFHVGVTHLSIPGGEAIDLTTWKIPVGSGYITVWSDLLTVSLILLFTNSMNWLDGSPGLPSGISFIAAVILFLLALRPGMHAMDQSEFATLAIILAGVCAGFLCFDFPPAKFLMGDTGSMFLGFTLGSLAILAGGKLATTFLILGVPLLDAFLVILGRIRRGKKPWEGDLTHLHHRLQRAGFSAKQTALVIYGGALLFGGVALFLRTEGKVIAIGILILTVFLWEAWLGHTAKNKD